MPDSVLPPMRPVTLLLLVLVLLAASSCATARGGRGRLADFTTDGCSLFPDGTRAQPDLWCDCCLRHDLAYWRGGSADDRLAADQALRACVLARTGDPALARTVFAGVRAGGAAVFPTGFRWGYGWPYGRGNRSLSAEERARVDAVLEAYLRRNPALRCGGDAAAPGAAMPAP